MFWCIRAKHPGTGDKHIRPMHMNGDGYALKEWTFAAHMNPVYGLDRLAVKADSPVWIVEGEQKADSLNTLGIIATKSGSASGADGGVNTRLIHSLRSSLGGHALMNTLLRVRARQVCGRPDWQSATVHRPAYETPSTPLLLANVQNLSQR